MAGQFINNATLLSGLVAYRDELTAKEILTQPIFEARTAAVISVATGVKGTQTINVLTPQLVLTAAACGLQAGTGSITLSQQNITVNDCMVQEDICYLGSGTLAKYYTGVTMRKGVKVEDLTPPIFAAAYIADKQKQIMNMVEKMIWQSNNTGSGTFSTDTNMVQTNGLLYQLNYGQGTASVVSGNGTYSGALVPGYAVDILKYMVSVIPQDIADKDLVAFMSVNNYNTLKNAIIDKNNFFFTAVGEDSYKFKWPYAGEITVMATSGLVGRNDIILTEPSNLWYGCDLESDFDTFDIWDSKDLNSIRFRSLFRLGTAIAFPQYVVYYKG